MNKFVINITTKISVVRKIYNYLLGTREMTAVMLLNKQLKMLNIIVTSSLILLQYVNIMPVLIFLC